MNAPVATWHFPAMQTALNSIIQPIGLDDQAAIPEWIHLIPAGTFTGIDGRGPYDLTSPEGVIAASAVTTKKLPIDVNHAIDLQGKSGGSSPAMAWIVALESRADGIWGRVEWTPEGRWAMASKSYGFISPVFTHTKDAPHQVIRLLRAALTNDPNLTLTALHQREESTMLEQLRKALGLPETADEAAVLAAVSVAHAAQVAQEASTALMGRIAEAAGVAAGTAGDALVTAIQSARTGAAGTDVDALRNQVVALQNQLSSYVMMTAKDKATEVVDAAIKAGKLVPVLRDHYIARHQKEPQAVEKEIEVLPSINAGGLGGHKPALVAGAPSADEQAVIAQMGVDPKVYAETAKTLYGTEA